MGCKTGQFIFFPTPYPDEILYSVLCRYHMRAGNTSTRQTNFELWGKYHGKNIFLPTGIEHFVKKIPEAACIQSDRIVSDNTVFPLIKPFISQKHAAALADAIKNGDSDIRILIGFLHNGFAKQLSLRYCEECVLNDISTYGEAYWHRIHQLPGIFICPKHGCTISDSDFLIPRATHEFRLPSVLMKSTKMRQAPHELFEKLLVFSKDTDWMLNNGYQPGFSYEKTSEKINKWLRVKGFVRSDGKTYNKNLGIAIADFYGKSFLDLFGSYDSGFCMWCEGMVNHRSYSSNPAQNLLLLRFLAGSPEAFFKEECIDVEPPSFFPFGKPPWPCRNHICEHHLQNVIERIDDKMVYGNHCATFTCPFCGMAYRRKKVLPKEKQYSGQITVVEYGWKWMETLKALFEDGKLPSVIASEMHCHFRTVMRFGVEFGFIPKERLPKRQIYVPRTKCSPVTFEESRGKYRRRWEAAYKAYPNATLSELKLIVGSSTQSWLRKNDPVWLEQNSPISKTSVPYHAGRDDEYLELVKAAIIQFKNVTGKPVWINFSSVSMKSGIPLLDRKVASGFLPKTKTYLDENIETVRQWQKRKVLWAIMTLRQRGSLINWKTIKATAAISEKQSAELKIFAFEYMKQDL